MRPLVGVGLIAAGGILVFGGVTGRLGPMLAALFMPSQLTESAGAADPGNPVAGKQGPWESFFGGIG